MRTFRTPYLLVLILLLLAGCRTPAPVSTTTAVTDDLGRKVSVSGKPVRIVSLAPSITEILFALGAGDRVAGVTSYCDFPAEARSKPKVGDTIKPDLERIVALKPDLVLISTASQLEDFTKRLEGLNTPAFVTNPRTVEDVFHSIEQIGAIIGEASKAQNLVMQLRARTSQVQSRAANTRPRVLYILQLSPLITAGSNTFINDLIIKAGGESISGMETADYPQFSRETVIARAPELIVIPKGHGTEILNINEVKEVFKETPAVRNNRLLMIDPDLIDRPGPRLIDGLEELRKAFDAK